MSTAELTLNLYIFLTWTGAILPSPLPVGSL